jgi:hypothetical protein
MISGQFLLLVPAILSAWVHWAARDANSVHHLGNRLHARETNWNLRTWSVLAHRISHLFLGFTSIFVYA